MKSFTKKGYYCGGKYLVFKSYGNGVQGVLQSPALEDEEGYIVHTTYSISINPKEQLRHLLASFGITALGNTYFRVFDENGEPYDDI